MPDIREMVFGALKDLYQHKIKVSHRAEFRASSFGPDFCNREVILQQWGKKAGRVPKVETDIASQIYMEIGTAIHEVLQQYFGAADLAWGCWECRRCGKVWMNCKWPGRHCGSLPFYIEYSCVHPSGDIGEVGHTDLILPLPVQDYVVCEFKTTGTAMYDKRKKGPAEAHHHQGSLYFEMFEKGYIRAIHRGPPTKKHPKGEMLWDRPAKLPPGKPVAILFIYVSRDKPRPSQWIPLLKKPLHGILKEKEKEAKRNAKLARKGKMPEGRCKKWEDSRGEYGDRCPWAFLCFSPERDELAKDLYKRACSRGYK